MLMPKRVKFRKSHAPVYIKGNAKRGTKVSFGEYGLKSLDSKWVTARQIEAARVAMTRFCKKGGKIWVRIFPDRPITKHPAETRMGKGKGAPEVWVAVVKPGRVMFELEGLPRDQALRAMKLASDKLPVGCRVVTRDEPVI